MANNIVRVVGWTSYNRRGTSAIARPVWTRPRGQRRISWERARVHYYNTPGRGGEGVNRSRCACALRSGRAGEEEHAVPRLVVVYLLRVRARTRIRLGCPHTFLRTHGSLRTPEDPFYFIHVYMYLFFSRPFLALSLAPLFLLLRRTVIARKLPPPHRHRGRQRCRLRMRPTRAPSSPAHRRHRRRRRTTHTAHRWDGEWERPFPSTGDVSANRFRAYPVDTWPEETQIIKPVYQNRCPPPRRHHHRRGCNNINL